MHRDAHDHQSIGQATDRDLTISFAYGGNSLSYVHAGWACPEPDFTWTIGAESHLVLPCPEAATDYFLSLDVIPFVHGPELPSQRLSVRIGSVTLGTASLSRPSLVTFRLPAASERRSGNLRVTLEHPDAASPSSLFETPDSRPLAFAVREAKLVRIPGLDSNGRNPLPGVLEQAPVTHVTEWATRRTGLAIPDLAKNFESLGENCEFGLFQRRCDAEPLGLLRFSSTFVRNLIRGLETGFEGLGEAKHLDPRLEGGPPREYMIHEKKYDLVYHTFVYEGQRSLWLLREQESARLKFLLRKFMDDLKAAEKIFVYKNSAGVSEAEVLSLHLALIRHCRRATLLWVVPAQPDRPVGTIETILPGLMKGYIDRFAPNENAHDLSFDGWLQVTANAYVLAQRQQQPHPTRTETLMQRELVA